MDNVTIPMDLAKAIITYLETRPIREALPIFAALNHHIKTQTTTPKEP